MPKILLVEDNEMNRDMLSRRLLRHGYDVSTAEDGEQALIKVKLEKPDLVLMDLSIPIIDGWEATRRIKDDPETNHIPIIALTAHALIEDREKALSAGCDDYEIKPLDFPKLLEKIQNLL